MKIFSSIAAPIFLSLAFATEATPTRHLRARKLQTTNGVTITQSGNPTTTGTQTTTATNSANGATVTITQNGRPTGTGTQAITTASTSTTAGFSPTQSNNNNSKSNKKSKKKSKKKSRSTSGGGNGGGGNGWENHNVGVGNKPTHALPTQPCPAGTIAVLKPLSGDFDCFGAGNDKAATEPKSNPDNDGI